MAVTTLSPREQVDELASSITLPSGLVLRNRLVKAAMAEGLAKPNEKNLPNERMNNAYREWGNGGWGLVITGNVQVDQTHLGTPFDTTVRESDLTDPIALKRWKAWAEACKGDNATSPTPTIVQICHTGRQSTRGVGRGFFEPSKSASNVSLQLGSGVIGKVVSEMAFGKTKAMTLTQIEETVKQFVVGAEMCSKAGFEGVQLHAAHGYLLAQFLSPKSNLRDDDYGYRTPEKGLKLLFRIVEAIRAVVPKTFTIAVKLNSKDYVDGGLTEDDAIEQVRLIIDHGGVDLIEISGGTYESPKMMADAESETQSATAVPKAREAFFTHFSLKARERFPDFHFMVTGGFRDRQVMAEAVASGACHLVGVGRPACLYPDIPRLMLDETIPNFAARVPQYSIRGSGLYKKIVPLQMVGAGINTVWHQWQIHALAAGEKPDPERSVVEWVVKLYGPIIISVLLALMVILALLMAFI